MKWFLALKEGHAFENYSKLVQVAIYTAQKYTSLSPFFIYDGHDNFLTDWLKTRNVPIIYRRSFIYDELKRMSERKNDTNILSIGSGAFLRTEIPQICVEQNIRDEFVLYTDVDIMFRRDVTDSLEKLAPEYFAVAPEFDKTDYKQMNSGVMLMNVKKLRSEDENFRKFIVKNLESFVANAWDQTAYINYYKGRFFGFKWDKLAPELNWKSYWGNYDTAEIIHFHGPKPFYRPFFDGDKTPEELITLLPLLTAEYVELCRIWDDYYTKSLHL